MTIIQKPNPPAILAAIGFFVSLVTSGIFFSGSILLFAVAGIFWSYLEITSGVNTFRKVLGWLGLFFVIVYVLYRFTHTTA